MHRLWWLALLAGAPVAASAPPPQWVTNCTMCHQNDGQGAPGLYPRLNGRLNQVAQKPEGRAWLLAVMLHGQTGRITIDGRTMSGVMMSFARLPDNDIAAVLNHAISLGGKGKAKPFNAAEVKAARALPRRTASEVKTERDRLVAAGVIP